MIGSGETKNGTTLEDLLAEVSARETKVSVLLRQELLTASEDLDAELAAVMSERHDMIETIGPELAERKLALEAEIAAAHREFRFRQIAGNRWAALMAKHPPTREQRRDDGLDHNPETFPPVAIAASCIAIDGTPVEFSAEQFQPIWDGMNVRERAKLWSSCFEANVGAANTNPKSLMAGPIARLSAQFGTTAAPVASPDPSSSVE